MNYLGKAGGMLGSAGRTFAGRAAMGGIAGGITTGSWGGVAGGAAAAGAGWGAMTKYAPRLAGRGANIASRAMYGLGNKLGRGAFDMTVKGAAKGWGREGAYGLGRGLMSAGNRLGQAGTMTNKWGGRALAGMGVASGAMIGSSILSSNRGYR